MKTRHLFGIIAFFLLIGLSASTVFAQDPGAIETPPPESPGISVGIAGGATLPQADLDNAVDTGFHLMGILDGIALRAPMGVRADVTYGQMPDILGGSYMQYQGTINARFEIPQLPASPYLIGGIGLYADQFTDTHPVEPGDDFVHRDTDLQTNVGANAGIGVRLGDAGGMGLFIESRYHNVFGADFQNQFVPITLGIML